MPKVIDAQQRRSELSWAACRALAAKGIEGVTMRDVAAEAGCSTGMVTHYFADKEELLVTALATATDACHRRLMQRAIARPLHLRDVMSGSLPLDEGSRLEWAVWLSYWAAAVNSDALAEEQRRHYRAWHQIVESVLINLRGEGRLLAGVDPSAAADFLMAVVDGLGVRATIDPESWTQTRLLEHLDRALSGVEMGWAADRVREPRRRAVRVTEDGRGSLPAAPRKSKHGK